LAAIRKPLSLGSDRPLEYVVTASIGIACGDRMTAGELLRDADVALYEAKAAGNARYAVFQPTMQQVVDERLQFEMELRAALTDGQFFLAFQPTFSIASGTPTGVEALLRWAHPTQGVVGPDQFIPILESSGLIVPVGRWVLREACRVGALFHAQNLPLTMSVNVSARQFETDALVSDVAEALADSTFDPGSLVLELTESTIMIDRDAAAQRILALKETGVRVAIDDFGTGYSALSRLRFLAVDILKIDRSFVSSMTESGEARMLVRSLIRLGTSLHMEVVAEGIETPEQLTQLQEEGSQTGQGFLYATPLTLDRLLSFLSSRIPNDSAGRSRAQTPSGHDPRAHLIGPTSTQMLF
ncbi:MAG: GGDEF domain-containing phosphodiesterase, partial [Nitrososphaerales archaeon]